ncbi:hypothetical protein [Enemella evansiae]|uniref:hypothetical protein n=1 Tax=Enemella evansiae TaxID=2016499 RepID=UPI00117D3AB8|nr:hypothetical protein [Enemella evansiae]
MSMPLGPRPGSLPPIHLDPEPLDRGWRPPRRGDQRWSASQKLLVVVAILLLAFGVILTAGGFAKRGDRAKTYAAGQVVDVGPFTLTLERVEITLQPKAQYNDADFDKFAVVAFGTATSKLKRPTAVVLDPALVMLENGRQFKARMQFGDEAQPPSTLAPGLTGVPVRITAEIPATWRPTGLLQVGVWQQKYGRQSEEMADSRKNWGKTQTALLFWCPVTRMPDRTN